MLWLLNKNILNDNIKFYQIFYNIHPHNSDDNIICNLNNNNNNNDLLTNYHNVKMNFEIKIMGNIIMFHNLNNHEILTFTKKNISNDIINNNLVLSFDYKLINNHRLPQLSSYDFYYSNLLLDIYYINTNKFFIIQHDVSNNSLISYWIQDKI